MSFVKIASFAACHDGFESKCISNSMRYLSGRNMFENFYDIFLSHCSGIKQLQSTWKILAHNKIGLFFGDPFKRSLTMRSLLSPTVSERFRAVLLGNSHICSECSISEVRANFRNSSEFFRAYSDQFRATGRNHSDMIRTYSEQIPSKFRSYPSVLIRAIPNKEQ